MMGIVHVRDFYNLKWGQEVLVHKSDLKVQRTAVMGSQTLVDLVAWILGMGSTSTSVRAGLEATRLNPNIYETVMRSIHHLSKYTE